MQQIECVFCGLTTDRAKEHVWPLWLQNLVGAGEYRGIHLSSCLFPLSERAHSMSVLVFGKVCTGCNNGWMSQLENDFKKIFIQIRVDYKKIESLNKEERKVICDWSFKTITMMNYATNYRQIVPLEHPRNWCFFKQIPKDVKIDISYIHEFQDLNCVQTNISKALFHQGDLDFRFKNKSYIIALQIENLGIKVSYYEDAKKKNFLIGNIGNKFVRIWPYKKNGEFSIRVGYENIKSMTQDTILCVRT